MLGPNAARVLLFPAYWSASSTYAFETPVDTFTTTVGTPEDPAGPGSPAKKDLFIDPICPYTWVAACWLREVVRHRPVDVRHHVMSLHLLNAGGVLERRYAAMVGPSRVATAVLVALLAGGVIGNLFASKRRPPPRMSVYGTIDRRLQAERETSSGG